MLCDFKPRYNIVYRDISDKKACFGDKILQNIKFELRICTYADALWQIMPPKDCGQQL